MNNIKNTIRRGWQTTASSAAALLSRFDRSEAGNVSLIFALSITVIMGAVGGAVDYGRWANATNQLQNALDAAVLAATRESQVTNGDIAAAKIAGEKTFDAMKSKMTTDGTSNKLTITPSDAATVFTGRAEAAVNTPFLSFLGVKELAVVVDSKAKMELNDGSNIEVSMMLDTTGSMCTFSGGNYNQPCTSADKLNALKDAAKDLIDIVVWDNQTQFSSKIAIAPFTASVNVGVDYYHKVTNEGQPGTATKPVTTYASYSYPGTCYDGRGRLMNSCRNQAQYGVDPTTTYVATDPCVIERTGAMEYSEDVPGPAKWIPSLASVTSDTCPEITSIRPLTNDKVALKATIDNLRGYAGTAGALGTAWAWYLVSPEWSSIFTGSAAPQPYSQLTEMVSNGQGALVPKLKKIVVLMTDGAYNHHHYSNMNAAEVSAKAVALCTAMKNKGITVFTVGFQLNSDATAISTLTDCASPKVDPDGQVTSGKEFINADSGDQLKQAFREIALKISTLRITQ